MVAIVYSFDQGITRIGFARRVFALDKGVDAFGSILTFHQFVKIRIANTLSALSKEGRPLSMARLVCSSAIADKSRTSAAANQFFGSS